MPSTGSSLLIESYNEQFTQTSQLEKRRGKRTNDATRRKRTPRTPSANPDHPAHPFHRLSLSIDSPTHPQPLERPVSACAWICTERTGPTEEAKALKFSSVVLHAKFPMNTTFVAVPAAAVRETGGCVVCVSVLLLMMVATTLYKPKARCTPTRKSRGMSSQNCTQAVFSQPLLLPRFRKRHAGLARHAIQPWVPSMPRASDPAQCKSVGGSYHSTARLHTHRFCLYRSALLFLFHENKTPPTPTPHAHPPTYQPCLIPAAPPRLGRRSAAACE